MEPIGKVLYFNSIDLERREPPISQQNFFKTSIAARRIDKINASLL